MVFASSDVASLLHRWEVAEYVSEGFVIVGCAGELVADFFTRLPENIRKHIGTWSTIVLILALAIGLKCLIRTNELSGSVIGSLGDKATEADGKAEKAISDSSAAFSQATDALTRAGKAELSLGKAENEAKDARNAASNALTITGNTRKEADSFENDIVSAKTQAAEAESHLADAMNRASAAEEKFLHLQAQMADREVTTRQRRQMFKLLVTHPPSHIVAQSLLSAGPEALEYAGQICSVFRDAHWTCDPPSGMGSFSAPISGVFLVAGKNSEDLTDFVARVLIAGEIAKMPVTVSLDTKKPDGTVEIWVSRKEPAPAE
jgi:hypothetical protein